MDAHSIATRNTDSSEPTPNREAFAMLENEGTLQRFVDGGTAAKGRVDARSTCGDGGILCF
jgi:hypothetical protein